MDNILPAYNDPLFSLLIIVLLVLIVAVTSYVMGNIKEEQKEKSLKQFLNRFNKQKSLLEIEEMPFEYSLIKPLSLLALAFKNQGEYQKSINLYLYLIKNITAFEDKEEILEKLGQTYLKAGFLKRSESIFLQILHKHARNKEALYHLGIVYELLHEYDKAIETLLPLKILGEDTKQLEAHLKLNQLLESKKIDTKEKVEQLSQLLDNEIYDYRRIVKALFSLDLERAWQSIKTSKIQSIIDILWYLPTSNLNFDIILTNNTLRSIFLANGEVKFEEDKSKIKMSNIFAIDTIVSSKQAGNNMVDLTFSYGCNKCKQHFPITFIRCPQCYAINSIQLHETLTKKCLTTGYSLL